MTYKELKELKAENERLKKKIEQLEQTRWSLSESDCMERAREELKKELEELKKTGHYYSRGGVETIDLLDQFLEICKEKFGDELAEKDYFTIGNIFKYICRAGVKTPDPTADLTKAADYVCRLKTGKFFSIKREEK